MKAKMNFLKNSPTIILGLCFILMPPAFGMIALELNSAVEYESKILKKESGGYVFDIKFPEIVSPSLSFDSIEHVNEAIREFVDGMSKDDIEFFIADEPEVLTKEFFRGVKNELMIDYKVVHLDDRFVSIKFEKYLYGSGAAHGNTSVECFNYDFKNQGIFRLSDLFEPYSNYLEQISALAIRDLKDQRRRDFLDHPEVLEGTYRQIEDGASPSEENLGEFTFNGGFLLTIYFQKYQVACGAAGNPEVNIWTDALQGWEGLR